MTSLEPPQMPPKQEWPNWTDDRAGRRMREKTIPIGIAGTIIIHLLFLGIAAWLFPDVGIIERPIERNEPLEVEFLPPPPPLPEFTQTNPMANQEVVETERIAAQDQAAAQEIPDPVRDEEDPNIEGEMLEATNIVSGDMTAEPAPPTPLVEMSEPAPAMPPSPTEAMAEPTEAQPDPYEPTDQPPIEVEQPKEQTVENEKPQYLDQPISEKEPGMDDLKATEVEEAPTEEDGYLAATKIGEAEIRVEETVEETAQPERGTDRQVEVYMEEVAVAPAEQGAQSSDPRPQARPRLNFIQSTSGPIKMQQGASSRVGAIAVDAKFDKFGAYLQRMIEAIDLQWQLMVRQSLQTVMAEMGSRVVVQYTINQDGEVVHMEVLFSSASRTATAICVDAIQSRAPFGVWTEEMVRTLGTSQKVTITYYFR